ncbi:MAG TPA: MBL fold metallo-hydrolase [bacterium]|nr:MBL fold metallo-hydrolase [bacterium]
MKTIDVKTLRNWLEEGRPVTVLDVREAPERNESAIPGSSHVNAYRALKTGDAHALDAVHPPKEIPVVTVCNRGNTSLVAAEQLEARGIEALSLDGGMKAWSLAWNTADVPLPAGSPAQVLQVRRSAKGCLSYIAASRGIAAVIDPSVEAGIYLQLCRKRGWQIRFVLETHIHADHLSRGRQLAREANAELILPANDRATFAHKSIADGQALPMGNAQIIALATPGHTPESIVYLLDEDALFSGDTLFLRGVGRPDLHRDLEQTARSARSLHQSLQRVLALKPSVLVLPAHTGPGIPFDGIPIAAPIQQVRAQNEMLALDEADFIRTITANIPPTPPNYQSITQLNERGASPEGDPTDLESGANRCAIA